MVEAETVGPTRYAYPYCIMVNTNGERFINEGEDIVSYTYAKTGREVAKQPGAVAFQIFDAKVKDLLWVEYKNAVGVESNSLEDLAEQCDINVENFVKTVKQYNASITAEDKAKPFLPEVRDGRRTHGLNPDKTNWAQTIDTPPFLAYAIVRGLTFAFGGIKINEKTQVMDTRDHPIEGLYAIGEVPGGLFYHNYMAGSGLTKGAITGRIAAEQAVNRSQKIKNKIKNSQDPFVKNKETSYDYKSGQNRKSPALNSPKRSRRHCCLLKRYLPYAVPQLLLLFV